MYPYIFQLEIPWLGITLEPRFYGLFYAISLLIGSKIFYSEFVRRKIPLDEEAAMNMTMVIFVCSLLGGRAYEVVFEWSNFYSHQPFWKVFAVWEGGLAIHGGILGGILSTTLYCKYKNLVLLAVLDVCAICITLGQAIGRWGNFTNGEAGGPVTDLWTGIVFPARTAIDYYAKGASVHPTMIYESLGCFLIFALLWKLRLKNFRPGMLTSIYLISYSILRFSLTPLRMDNQYFYFGGTTILAAYAISIILFSVGVYLIVTKKLWLPDDNLSG